MYDTRQNILDKLLWALQFHLFFKLCLYLHMIRRWQIDRDNFRARQLWRGSWVIKSSVL